VTALPRTFHSCSIRGPGVSITQAPVGGWRNDRDVVMYFLFAIRELVELMSRLLFAHFFAWSHPPVPGTTRRCLRAFDVTLADEMLTTNCLFADENFASRPLY
jgi:hypothetical protein